MIESFLNTQITLKNVNDQNDKEGIKHTKQSSLSPKNHILNKKLKYNEDAEFEDTRLYCYECNKEYIGECKSHKSRWILNKRVVCPYTTLRADSFFDEYYNEKLDITECYCKENSIKHIKTTLPKGIFLIKSQIQNTTYGIWTNNYINQGTILGPFLGTLTNDDLITDSDDNIIEDEVQDFIWNLTRTDNTGDFCFVDARNCITANYLRFIRCSKVEGDINLAPLQFDGKIFYQALKTIAPLQELIVSYNIKICQPRNCQYSLTIRKIPFKDKFNFKNEKKIIENMFQSNINKKKRNERNNFSISRDINNENSSKVDKDIKRFIKEMVTKYPLITGAEANQLLRKKMPHKPFLSDESIHLLTQEFDVDPVLGMEEVLDEYSAYELIKIFRLNPEISCRSAKVQIDELFPEKPPITYETIDRIVRMNKLPFDARQRRRINSNVCDAISLFLESDPWMSSKDLNNLLQDVFPEGHKISLQYLNQLISKNKLRPIRNARRKLDEEMKKIVLDLFYKHRMKPSEISQKLNDEYPDRPFISGRCIRRMIKSSNAVIELD